MGLEEEWDLWERYTLHSGFCKHKAAFTVSFCLLIIFQDFLILFYMYECFACMHVCAPRPGDWIPWNWSNRWL